ncbi:MAG: HlyC/CorC family transporter [Planctomycetes bacterium]|nr:HlyC/CorC family transporter [Planctomycetota bacterium]
MHATDVLIFLLLLSCSAFFSGTETALTATSRVALHKLAESGSRRARLIEKLLADKGRMIAALLVGNNIVNTILAVFATVVFDGIIADSGLLPPWAAPVVASLAAIVVLLVFGEVLPKCIGVVFPARWAMAAAWPSYVLLLATRPVTWVLKLISDIVMLVLGRRKGHEDIFDLQEIHATASMAEQAGVIDEQEAELIAKASQLNDIRVREIMIPRTDVQGIEVHASLEEIRAMFRRLPFSRVPVFKTDFDDIVGILNFKELLRQAPAKPEDFDLVSFLHKPLFVPETMFIGDLLKQMQKRRTHLAIALDEYGGTAGLVTLEDVVEMLVGRIEDEYDEATTPFRQLDGRTWEVDGRVTVDQFLETLGLKLEEEALQGFDTAAGLALVAFGNIPSEGAVAAYHGLEITVLRLRGNRVRRLRVKVLTPEERKAAEAAAAERKQERGTGRLMAPSVPAMPPVADRSTVTKSPVAADQPGGREQE